MKKCCNRLRLRDGIDDNLPTPIPTTVKTTLPTPADSDSALGSPGITTCVPLFTYSAPSPSPPPPGQMDADEEEAASRQRQLWQLDAVEASWRAEHEARQETSYYAASYSSWVNYGSSIVGNIVANLQVLGVRCDVCSAEMVAVP